jgi:CubicO group peptidase (beta-lactamase class C family)
MSASTASRATACIVLALSAAPNRAPAQPVRTTAVEASGLSVERLARITATMNRYVEEGRIAGTVSFVARNGRVAYFETAGKRDLEKNLPMEKDTIFRIASMTKAVTSVAAMILVEEGRLLLSDPVSKFLPRFKKTVVLATPLAPVPAKREITIRDLLTHTSGLSYGTGPAEAQYRAAGAYLWYFADKAEPIGVVVDRMAGLPLDAQPGERWIYGFSTDVLGRVIEVVSGQDLDTFFRSRIFEPLMMDDTSFFLPAAKRARLATVYAAKSGGAIERSPEEGRGQGDYVDGPRKCFSGGAGLLSTAGDYARFLQMLLGGGALDGVRILSPKTVQLMTANQVGSLHDDGRAGFGLGFEVIEDVGRAGKMGSPGAYGWGSAYYSSYWVDPSDKLVAIFLSQLLPAGDLDLQAKFRNLVYQAVVGPPGLSGK